MYGVLLNEIEGAQDFCEEFKGLNRNMRRGAGEFYDMKNMTMDDYPVFSTRKKRSESSLNNIISGYGGKINGVKSCFDGYIAIVKGSLLIITNQNVLQTYTFNLNESENIERNLVYIGNYLVIFPDNQMVTVNKNPENSVDMKNHFKISNLAESFVANIMYLSACDADGEAISFIKGESQPENSSSCWYDTTKNTMKKYSEALNAWVETDTYIYIKFPFNKGLKQGQSFTVSMSKGENFSETQEDIYDKLLNFFGENGENIITINKLVDDRIIIKTNATNSEIISISPIILNNINFVVKTIIPNFDCVCEGNNRIWGCRYGLDYKGDFVNEIYCSALGDFSSWYSYEGASTDSYTLSLGVEGSFLKAVFYGGKPVFFKENAILTIYGDYPSNYQLNIINTKGVQNGSSESVVVTENGIFYKSNDGVYLYDGSAPVNIGANLGNEKYHNAVAGANGYKYYISMKDKSDNPNLFVFDYSNGFWVREDETKAKCFVNFYGDLLMLSGKDEKFYSIDSAKPNEKDFEWFFETGTVGYSQAENKYIGRFNIRMSLGDNTRVDLWIQYDSSGHFEHLGSMKGVGLQSYNLPVVPHRCDHFNIKISGKGEAKIFSIAKMLYSGGAGI